MFFAPGRGSASVAEHSGSGHSCLLRRPVCLAIGLEVPGAGVEAVLNQFSGGLHHGSYALAAELVHAEVSAAAVVEFFQILGARGVNRVTGLVFHAPGDGEGRLYSADVLGLVDQPVAQPGLHDDGRARFKLCLRAGTKTVPGGVIAEVDQHFPHQFDGCFDGYFFRLYRVFSVHSGKPHPPIAKPW